MPTSSRTIATITSTSVNPRSPSPLQRHWSIRTLSVFRAAALIEVGALELPEPEVGAKAAAGSGAGPFWVTYLLELRRDERSDRGADERTTKGGPEGPPSHGAAGLAPVTSCC